ncbi:hypothetical protein [Deinococcus puniceus]|uniref:hypothetical protein n=1 Tax=Deinococcus puniceus TaxID=1182568 RepID=UPI000B05769F|nr:hypothetical protein [Deinococcus puniceus]
MRESAPQPLARPHTLLDPSLPAWQQFPSDTLIWTQASQWMNCPKKERLSEAKALLPNPR